MENPILPAKAEAKRRPPPRPVSQPATTVTVSVKKEEPLPPAKGTDLLGSLSEELAARPVIVDPQQRKTPKSFQDMHREIGRQIKSSLTTRVGPEPDLQKYDSFDSSSDDDRQVRIYSSDRIDSFESDSSFYRGVSITSEPRSGSKMAQNLNYYNEVYSSQNLNSSRETISRENYNEVYQVTPEMDEDSDEMDALGKELDAINQVSNLTVSLTDGMSVGVQNHNPEFLTNGYRNESKVNPFDRHFPADLSLNPPNSSSALVPVQNAHFPVSFPVLTPSIRPLNPITENRSITPQPIRPSYPAIAERSRTPEPQSPTKQRANYSATNPFAPKYSPRSEAKSIRPEMNLEDAFSWFNKKSIKCESTIIPVEEARIEKSEELTNKESSPLKLPLDIETTQKNTSSAHDWVDFSSPTQEKVPDFPSLEEFQPEEQLGQAANNEEIDIIPAKPPRNIKKVDSGRTPDIIEPLNS